MTAPYIQKLVAERGSAQFAIGCRTDSEKEASLLQIPLQMQQNDNPEDGARGMGCPGARDRFARPAAGLVSSGLCNRHAIHLNSA
jgi:hypothetical protein